MSNIFMILVSVFTFLIALVQCEQGDELLVFFVGLMAFVAVIISIVNLFRDVDFFDM